MYNFIDNSKVLYFILGLLTLWITHSNYINDHASDKKTETAFVVQCNNVIFFLYFYYLSDSVSKNEKNKSNG